MESFKIINVNEKEKWKNIIDLFDNADIYYSDGYVNALKIHGDGEPILIYYKNEKFSAVNVAMKRKINDIKKLDRILDGEEYYDLSTPYGYGGFIFKGEYLEEDLNEFNKQYINFCLEQKIVSEFVRFHPNSENYILGEKLYETIKLGETVTIELNNENEIWTNIISKNRNMIRKAQKNNVQIKYGHDETLISRFMELYKKTMDRDAATDYYYFKKEYYENLFNDLEGNIEIFYAEYDNKIISASIIMFDKKSKNIHYHLSASDYEFRNLAPTNLLLYEVAIWGSKNGYERFHLGGGLGSKEDNLYKFKKSFYKGENTEFYIGKKIFNESIYTKLKDGREETGFFPEYRS